MSKGYYVQLADSWENIGFYKKSKTVKCRKVKSAGRYSCKCLRCGRYFKSTRRSKWCGSCIEIRSCKVCKVKFGLYPISSSKVTCSRSCFNTLQQEQHSTGIFSPAYVKHYANLNEDYAVSNSNVNPYPSYESFEDYVKARYEKREGNVRITAANAKDFHFPGIWAKVDRITDEVLDVMITANIAKEYGKVKYRMRYSKATKYFYLRQHKVKYIFIEPIKSWSDGLRREMEYAIDTGAKYWSPAPGEQSEMYEAYNAKGNG